MTRIGLLALLSFAFIPPVSGQDPPCPVSPLQGLDATVTLQTSYDRKTKLYTYIYTVRNTGTKNVEGFMVTVSPPLSSVTWPTGWFGRYLVDNPPDPIEYSWYASTPVQIPPGTPDDGSTPPAAYPLTPGATMTFSFTSPHAPGPAHQRVGGDGKVDNVYLPPIPPGATEEQIYAAHEEAAEKMAELCPDLGGDIFSMSRLVGGQGPTTFTAVTVDVSPGIPAPNPVSPKVDGPVYVAILGAKTFNAATVDPASARLGRERAPAVAYVIEDVNGDGRLDMYLQFQMRGTGIGCFDKAVFLEATTTAGQRVRGYDLIAPSCP